MKRLIGKKVSNDELGEGVIIDTNDTDKGILITVEFADNLRKRYGFPMAIGKALKSDDEEFQIIADDIARAKEEARKRAEEEKLSAEEKQLKRMSDSMVEEAEKIIKGINRQQEFGPIGHGNFRIFKVHQGRTFHEEFTGGYVWAPASGNHHHEIVNEVQPGDIIFHYSGGNIIAIGEALSNGIFYPRPAELSGHGWGHKGYRVEVRYEKLNGSYSLSQHVQDIIANRQKQYSSFDSNGDACQGYMYELEYPLAKLFKQGILATSQPAGVQKVLNRIN